MKNYAQALFAFVKGLLGRAPKGPQVHEALRSLTAGAMAWTTRQAATRLSMFGSRLALPSESGHRSRFSWAA